MIKEKFKIFPYAAKPIELNNENNTHLYSLFFAISNDSGAAMKAANRIMEHLQKNLGS